MDVFAGYSLKSQSCRESKSIRCQPCRVTVMIEEKKSGIPELKEYALFEIGKRRKQ